jgi:hypothetical protein
MKMKIPAYCLASVFLYLITVSLFAKDQSIIVETRPAEKAAVTCFGGQELKIQLDIYGTTDKISILADLYQISTSLVVPVSKDLPVAENINLSENIKRSIDFTVRIPDVEKTTKFLLKYKTENEQGQWTVVGSTIVTAYPNNILNPIRTYGERNLISILGESKTLRKFLDSQKVTFESLGDKIPSDGKPRIILYERAENDWLKFPESLSVSQVLVVFYSPPSGIPRIFSKQFGGGALIEVKMGLMDKLDNKPEAQEIFLEIFKDAVEQLQGKTGREK